MIFAAVTAGVIGHLETFTGYQVGNSRAPGGAGGVRSFPDLIVYGSIDGDDLVDNAFIGRDGGASTVFQVTVTALSPESRDIALDRVMLAMIDSQIGDLVDTRQPVAPNAIVQVMSVEFVSSNKDESDDLKTFTATPRFRLHLNEYDAA